MSSVLVAIHLDQSATLENFVSSLRDGGRLVARVESTAGIITAIFSVSGVSDALNQMKNSCKWVPDWVNKLPPS